MMVLNESEKAKKISIYTKREKTKQKNIQMDDVEIDNIEINNAKINNEKINNAKINSEKADKQHYSHEVEPVNNGTNHHHSLSNGSQNGRVAIHESASNGQIAEPPTIEISVNGNSENGHHKDVYIPTINLAVDDEESPTWGAVFSADFQHQAYPDKHGLSALMKLPPILSPNGVDPIQINPSADELQALDELLAQIPPDFDPEDRQTLLQAYVVATYAHRNQKRQSGEPYILHPIEVTLILAQSLGMDLETLAAGLLHDVVEDTEFDLNYLRERFGKSIALLVDGVTKLKRINQLSNVRQGISDTKAESLRKMFLAMVEDIRVVLIKLADRVHNMRTLGSQKDYKQRRIARETLDIFAPLANRLGIWQIKWELEDTSFRYLDPKTYREIAQAMDQKRLEREQWVEQIKSELQRELTKIGIPAKVSGRPKHIYSIWRKMQRKDVPFNQIYDVHGFRVIVDSIAQCYAALGVVHSKWHPIPGEFDDYIANPKDNLYRSLHTAVLSPSGRPLEVQIRTHEMHDIAEYGIAAHWRYKEQTRHDETFDNKISWLRQLMEWRQEVNTASEFMDGMQTDVFNDRVYVFTPEGDVVDLPANSTPIDLAYRIHTDVGHCCRGANVNGKHRPLDYKLQTGDQVRVVTAKHGGPSRDWLNPNLEYVTTQRARSKIRSWLKKQDREKNIQRGRSRLDKEVKRLSISQTLEEISTLFLYEQIDDFLAAIGYGDVNSQHLAQRLLNHERSQQTAESDELKFTILPKKESATTGLSVQGMEGLLIQTSTCCKPVPGDAVMGYITTGRGITVHLTNCPNFVGLLNNDKDGTNHKRLIDVQWTVDHDERYPVGIQISAYDRAGLLHEVTGLVANEKINILNVEALTGQRNNQAVINITLEITDVTHLTRILTKIEQLPNVIDAVRRVA